MLDELDVTVICVVSSYGGQLEKGLLSPSSRSPARKAV